MKRSLAFLPVLFLGIFVLSASYNIEYPGLYYDEVLFVNAAVGAPTDLFVHMRVFGIPVMLMSYIGALKAWLYYPIFDLFGVSYLTIRLPVILISAAALWLTYKYVRSQFGLLTASLFIVMAAVEPSTMFHSRLDWGPTALMMFFRGGLLVALSAWLTTGNRKYLWLALLSSALGLFDKLNFVWIVSSAFLSGLVFYPERLLLDRFRQRGGILLVAAILTIMIILFVGVLHALGINLTAELGIDNFAERWDQFERLLWETFSGDGVYSFVTGHQNPSSNFHGKVLLFFFVASSVGIALGIKAGMVPLRPLGFLGLFILLLSLQILFTKRATGPHHLATLAPLWLIPLTVGLSSFIHLCTKKIKSVCTVLYGILPMAIICTSSIFVILHYHRGFHEKDINPFWDISSQELTERLLKMGGDKEIITVDWGIATNIQALSDNRLRVLDLWGDFNNDMTVEAQAWVTHELVKDDSIIVLHSKGREAFPKTRENFLIFVHRNELQKRHLFNVRTSDGREFYEVYSVGKANISTLRVGGIRRAFVP